MSSEVTKNSGPIVVIPFPKSGCTYLTRLIASVSGFPIVNVFGLSGGNEHYLDREQIKLQSNNLFVSVLHCPGTNVNINTINKFKFRTVLIYRNIFYTLISLHDFYVKEKFDRIEFSGPFTNYRDMLEEDQKWFLIHHVLPWYLKFFVSWELAKKNKRIDYYQTTYERLFQEDQEIPQLLHYLNISSNNQRIHDARKAMDERNNSKLNVGASGRGISWFNNNQFETTLTMTKYFTNIDFTKIGIVPTTN